MLRSSADNYLSEQTSHWKSCIFHPASDKKRHTDKFGAASYTAGGARLCGWHKSALTGLAIQSYNTNLQSTYRQILGWNKPILRQAPLPGDKPACSRFPRLVLFHLSALSIERLKISISWKAVSGMALLFCAYMGNNGWDAKKQCGFDCCTAFGFILRTN